MPANPLSLIDRAQIFGGLKRGESSSLIAVSIGRSRSTVAREIKRNGGPTRYCPDRADRRASKKRKRPKKRLLVADPVLAAEVQKRLKAGDSPMRISIELKAEGFAVSHETIYQAIFARLFGLVRTLRSKRKKRKPHGFRPPGSNSLGVYCSIHDRPAEALKREVFGHFEGDLIVGANNQSALITVFDMASRRLYLNKVASKSATDVKTGLCELLARIPERFRLSLAWDQGSELARHREIHADTGMHIYIADPKSPWQRGTNENGNGLVRNHVGKGTDLSIYTTADLRWIESRINTIPRRIFDWATANDTYNQLVAMTD